MKRDIELQRYAVDSAAVADAILSKLRLVKQGRQALADGQLIEARAVATSASRPR